MLRWKRWNAGLLGLAVVFATLSGCARQVFVNLGDLDEFNKRIGLPDYVTERNSELGTTPYTESVKEPGTVTDPERQPRYMSLQEAIALSLENNSTTGIQSVRQPGGINDDLIGGSPGGGVGLLNSDSIRVLALQPAVAGSAIEAALSRYDPKWITGITWQSTDQPIQGFNSFNNGDSARFDTALAKALPSGGVAGLVFSVPYQLLSRPPQNFPIKNPAYTPRAGVTFETPLLQNFGEINQLLPRHPGTSFGSQLPTPIQQFLNAGSGAGNFQQTGIIVARIRFDQSRAELERVVNFKLLNIEVAYWNLYGGYVNLYSIEQALRQTYEAWKVNKLLLDAGSDKAKPHIVARSLGQYQQLRADRLQALGRVLEAERVLRTLVGLPAEDGQRLVPIDTPTTAPYQPSWNAAVHDALTLRPELIAARQELKAQQLALITQKNFLKPDLRFTSGYFLEGLGTRLDGNAMDFDASTGTFRNLNAFRSMGHGHYSSWGLGLNLNVPLGYRLENAAVRAAQLSLAQYYLGLRREEEKALRFLVRAYRDVIENYKAIELRREERKAYGEELRYRLILIEGGKEAAGEFLLDAVRTWTNALNAETQAIVNYNNALVTFEFAKGTIMQHDNISISEGQLPECVYVRAVEHERKRSKSLVLRQRAQLVPQAPDAVDTKALSSSFGSMSSTPLLTNLVDAAATTTPPSNLSTDSTAAPLTNGRDVLTNDVFRPAQDRRE
jgi:outer membrane protein TolC